MPFSPKEAADACVARSRRFLELGSRDLVTREVSDDLCRFSLVTAVAAIDAYMHWLVFARLSTVRYTKGLPKALKRLDIPFEDYASLADTVIAAQQDRHTLRPWVQVKNLMQRQLLLQTFQSYDQVAGAFALAGIERAWSKVSSMLGAQPAQVRNHLNHLVLRRNQIVHEGDITRMSRPRDIRYNEIDYDAVVTDIQWIETLLGAMQTVVEAEDL